MKKVKIDKVRSWKIRKREDPSSARVQVQQREYPNRLSAENALQQWTLPNADHGRCMLFNKSVADSTASSDRQTFVWRLWKWIKKKKIKTKKQLFSKVASKELVSISWIPFQQMESKICSLGRNRRHSSHHSILPNYLACPNQRKAATLIKKLIDFDVHLRRFGRNQQAYKRLDGEQLDLPQSPKKTKKQNKTKKPGVIPSLRVKEDTLYSTACRAVKKKASTIVFIPPYKLPFLLPCISEWWE